MSDGPRGYRVLSKRSTAKSVLYFVRRWGRRYVVKEYIDYRFPDHANGAQLPEALKQVQRRSETYFAHLQKTARLMRRAIRREGLINIPLDVFRRERSIYKVTSCLDECVIEAEALHEHLNDEQMDVFLCTLLRQLEKLAEIGFVHCDLKPENVLICQRSKGVYSAALIDYDSGIVIGDDDEHCIDYTPEYAAPEMHVYKEREQDSDAPYLREKLNCAADMFSAACLMVQYLTGRAIVPQEVLPCELLWANRILWVPKMHPVWRTMIKKTLRVDPQRRLSAAQMLEGIENARRSVLMKELRAPFAGCGEGEVISCGGQEVLLRGAGGNREALWYLDEEWLSNTDGVQKGVWSIHDRTVRRRRESIKKICDQVNELRAEALQPVRTVSVGKRFFVGQKLPDGQLVKLSELHHKLSLQAADRFMAQLLEAMDKLHAQGLWGCLMSAEDVWGVVQKDGSICPVLGGLHRLVRRGALPDREEIDVYPQIVSPEVCMYLGQNDGRTREQIGEMIGEWSDLFSLGAVYHMLLTGRLPEAASGEEAYLGEAALEGYEDMPGLLVDESIDDRRRSLIERMLAAEPQDRPESCEEVLKYLDALNQRQQSRRTDQTVHSAAPVKEQTDEALVEEESIEAQQPEEPMWSDCETDASEVVYVDDDGLIWFDVPSVEAAEEPADAETVFGAEDMLEDVPEEIKDKPAPKAKKYILSEACGGAWCRVQRSADGSGAWAHPTGRERAGGSKQSVRLRQMAQKTRKLHKKCSGIMPIESISQIYGAGVCSVAQEEYILCSSAAEAAPDANAADVRMRQIIKSVQAVHEEGLLCGAVTADNTLLSGEEPTINIAEYMLMPDDERDRELWCEWMSAQAESGGAAEYLSPEAKRMIEGGAQTIGKASDIFSLGRLYHVLWCGKLPEAAHSKGGSRMRTDSSIPFAQRLLIEQMLSEDALQRPQSCEELLELLEQIILKRGKTHSVTVKRNEAPVAGRKAWLYAEGEAQDRFVAAAVTDRSGKAVFYGYLPEGKYYVRCDGEKVTCRWRKF